MPSPSAVVYNAGVWNYCQYSGITLLFYDYILTLSREITLVWRWPSCFDPENHRNKPCISMSSLLYFLMRYTLLISWAVTPALEMHPNAERSVFFVETAEGPCTPWLRFAQAMDIVSQTTVTLILLLRTYAMWSRNILILTLVGAVGLGIPGIGIWSILLTSCVNTFDASVASQLKLITMLFSLFSVIFDSLVVIFTGIRWHQMRKSTQLAQGDLARLIVQNGIVHYTFMFLGQLSTVIMFWAAPIELIGIGNYIVRSLSVNILSHFMLDLREMARVERGTSSTVAQTLSLVTLHGADLLGKETER